MAEDNPVAASDVLENVDFHGVLWVGGYSLDTM